MELLYGNQRKALKFLHKSYKKHTHVTKVILSKHLNLNFQETTHICNELKNKSFITFSGLNFDPKITTNGIEYFSFENLAFVSTVLKSVICPIIVSIITTLLALWLKG